jgi:hypothetical protein
MKFYLYRMNKEGKEYFAGKNLCTTYATPDRDKAMAFTYLFDAEQKIKDLSSCCMPWKIEETN